jgi:3-deoxy-manno-octulosonate cytidylyltransferase (CMP-KDO synthetase)
MYLEKRIACVIPARLHSTRFPKKMLSQLGGKPLLQWAWEAANRVSIFDTVTFAIDAEEIGELISTFGGKFIMTSSHCQSGTDRLVELEKRGAVDADIWVNWQGDEPFIEEEMLFKLLESCDDPDIDVWTLKKKIISKEEALEPSTVKVVTDAYGSALYFSRSLIPYCRDGGDALYFRHIGIYAFTKKALRKISKLPSCPLEEAEKLEQLRFLYGGMKIRVHETEKEIFGIDLTEHLAQAEQRLSKLIEIR